jgi:hypothetical protein
MNISNRRVLILITCSVIALQCIVFFTATRDWRVADILGILLGASVLALIVALLRGRGDYLFRGILGSLVLLYLLFWVYIWWIVRYRPD